ncbi:MAG: protein translocase subunit SecD [Isosphaeraceae bacterium]|nr:protein translocase subunit SecD [Isosphaeraceae bacterium]
MKKLGFPFALTVISGFLAVSLYQGVRTGSFLGVGTVLTGLLVGLILFALYVWLGTNKTPRFTLIGVATLLGLVAMWPPEEKLKLGIDLSGGTILVYQVKETGRGDYKIDDLIAALKRRINPEGVQDIPIRKVGNNRIEIILARATDEDVAELKRRITDVGSLEFRILANQKHDAAKIEQAMRPEGLAKPPRGYHWAKLGEIITGKNPRFDATHITDPTQSWIRDRYAGTQVTLTGKDVAGREKTVAVTIASNTADTLTLKEPHGLATITSYTIDFNPSKIQPGPSAIVRDQPRGNGVTDRYILVKLDRQNVTGEYLASVSQTQDERLQPAVRFVFKPIGGRKFGQLTRDHLPEEGGAFMYHLAILLDNLVMSAPVIKSEIRDEGVIEGVQPKEINHLILILRSGSLPASLDPTPLLEERVGPTLGKDTITKGIWAIGISMIIVPLFMIVYYRFAGVVAVVALVLNMILLVGSMGFIQATFTLPGLAGLALTIGMAVDANVLIFERMREEAERGASMAQQIRNGFSRAWTTILDSNVTTMLSGVVLYAVGTEEIKGFALTLIIGLIWNLFTAVYVSRVIFDLWYSQGWLKRLKMMKILDRTNIDFVGPRRYFMIGSAVVIALGLAAFFIRGRSLYNIDFTGGTLVTIQLDENAPEIKGQSEAARQAYVRQTASRVLPDASVESLNVGEERRGLRFNIRTTAENANKVKQQVLEAFQTSLARLEMTIGPGEPIPAEKPKAEAEAKETSSAQPADRFAGGYRYELTFNREVAPSKIRAELTRVLASHKIANPESRIEVVNPNARPNTPADAPTQTVVVRTNLDPDEAQKELKTLAANLRNNPDLLFERLENFGGAVAGETRALAAIAIVLSWAIMIAYLWVRFKSVSYGLAAVIALVHDVLIALGAVALSPYKIDLPMIAAFLTLIGFSVNDTIVIFDRIREIKGKSPYLTPEIVNAAVNQTLSRTILTSLTAWLVVVILYLFGGEGLQGFSFCLVVGFLSGTYSTIYIASPILIDWIGSTRAPAAQKPQMALREV